MGHCQPRLRLGRHWFSRGDNFHVIFSCSQYLLYSLFCTPYIQTLIQLQSESMVNCTHINSAQSIILGISPVVKQYYPLPRSINCEGVVSWFSGWYRFLSKVSQPIRTNYFTWKYDIKICVCITCISWLLPVGILTLMLNFMYI